MTPVRKTALALLAAPALALASPAIGDRAEAMPRQASGTELTITLAGPGPGAAPDRQVTRHEQRNRPQLARWGGAQAAPVALRPAYCVAVAYRNFGRGPLIRGTRGRAEGRRLRPACLRAVRRCEARLGARPHGPRAACFVLRAGRY